MKVRQLYAELLMMPSNAEVLIDGRNVEELVREGTTVQIRLEAVRTAPNTASILADL